MAYIVTPIRDAALMSASILRKLEQAMIARGWINEAIVPAEWAVDPTKVFRGDPAPIFAMVDRPFAVSAPLAHLVPLLQRQLP